MIAHDDGWLTIHVGDVRTVLPELPSDSVDCIVTSPPYWGLRDYGSDSQIGLERTPEEYVANMVDVFRELRRILKPSGTCWLNLGDSYATTPTGNRGTRSGLNGAEGERYSATLDHYTEAKRQRADIPSGLKPKDLVGIPWRVAFALQADGWYLRSDIIWAKPNPMPESVTDRPTKAHEYLFLLTKSARYYYDADAVREAHTTTVHRRTEPTTEHGNGVDYRDLAGGKPRNRSGKALAYAYTDGVQGNPAGRNIRSVWTIATKPYPGAHFAVFPPELPERCIKAGSSERGVCPDCGKPWERWIERKTHSLPVAERRGRQSHNGAPAQQSGWFWKPAQSTDMGWRPTCQHIETRDGEKYLRTFEPVSAVVLDPFAGSGTTGMVANRLSRRAILIDINSEYLEQQLTRNAQRPLGLGAGG